METIQFERLARWGEEAARSIPITGTVSGKKTAKTLAHALGTISQLAQQDDAPAWYADNEYLARREGAVAQHHFRQSGRLRRDGQTAALVTLCRRFIQAGPITEERMEEFLTGARRLEALPEPEAALFADGLRMAILLELAQKAEPSRAGELFTALRTLAQLDMTPALEHSDPVDALLRQDPVYPLMDEQSRGAYRMQCYRLARKNGCSALKQAQTALDQGLHTALFGEKTRSGVWYMAAQCVLAAVLSLAAGWLTHSPWTAVLSVLPLFFLSEQLINRCMSAFVPPRRLFRLACDQSVGSEGRTVCVLSALLTTENTAPALVRRLEEYYLANRDCGDDLLFALLADMPDSRTYPAPHSAQYLEIARQAVEDLNRRYGKRFYLLTRDPVWNAQDKVYTPWERKRGAIFQLCRLVQGQSSPLRCLAGEREALRANYLLCLDGDSRLTPGSARQLIGAALHPLNRPVIENGLVVRGHGVLHPRMSLELSAALGTDFARLYAGQGGVDPYGTPAGELWSDWFSRGGFSGKGLVDAAAYLTCLGDVIPENMVLSHDTLEGAYLKGGYLGDVELTDTAPQTAAGWFKRLHRWIRGDWQNLFYLAKHGKNLPILERWRILTAAGRSLLAPAVLLCLTLAFFVPSLAGAGAVALFCLGAEAVHNAFLGLFRPERDVRIRCRSGVLRGLGGALTRFGTRFILLPWEAFTSASAAVTALWRMTVSGKNRLQWVTAAQGETERLSSPGVWSSLAIGLALVLFAPGIGGKSVGLVWLASPLFAWSIGRTNHAHSALNEADRAFLRTSAQAMWSYFESLCTRSDHWLPPDNFQAQPPKGAARRTSPTNIGMAMASALAALEMKLCREEQAVELLQNMMTTLEALPRWHGHLYNWYDTATAAPMDPAYVSTVDSGNLCACLLCVSQGMAAHGHHDLARRMRDMADAMDFAPLYDEKRRLFRIGLDPTADTPSPGHYDLMASEARLTSYLACARGDVPLRHWQALSRAQLSLDGWRGLASWSGSMFEYLMPELFLPLVPGSMLWESGRFCLYAQRQHGRGQNVPWGNSESAFFALDGSLDYRYKAHGTGALALRRDMDSELVIAPYASFLALAVQPKAAVKNLRRLKKAGMVGRFGFYEALDKTPGRTGPNGQVVACFMSHHVGMSLCAAANCLEGGVLRRYFMADARFRAHQSLLAERVPLAGAVLRRSRSPLTPPPESRPENTVFTLSGAGYDPDAPAYFPLSNGVYSLLTGSDGTAKAQVDGLLLYEPEGFSLAVGDRLLTPSRSRGVFYPWQYTAGTLTFTASQEQEIFSANLAVAAGERAELRRITAPAGQTLSVTFAPVLAKKTDFDAHPAFWRLGLEVTAKTGAVFVRRLYRGQLPEVWLCLCAAVPLRLTSGSGFQMLEPVHLEATMPPGGCLTLALGFGRSRDDAWNSAKRSLTGAPADMAGSMAALLGVNSRGLRLSMALCAALTQGRTAGQAPPRPALWQHGISGDLPLLYGDAAQEDLDPARRLIKRHALLTACGISADLVLNTGETGDYDKPRTQALRRYMDKYGLLPFEDQSGGIHLVGDDRLKQAAVALPPPVSVKAPPLPGLPSAPLRGQAAPEITYLPGGAVSIQTPPLPPRAWCNVLTNGSFGYVAADCGTGFMWLENARECPVSPPVGDILATGGGEQLTFITALGRRSLFAGGAGRDCRVIHGFGWTKWEQDFASVTAFVPLGYKVRVMVIEGCSGGTIGWHLPLSLTDNAADGACVVTGYENGCLSAQNDRSLYPDGVFRALASQTPLGYTGHTPSWLQGRWDSRVGAGLEPCFGLSFAGGQRLVLVCGYEEESILRDLAQPERAAQELFRVQDSWRSVLSRVHVQTPDEDLNRMLNGWAAYQALSCRLLGRTSLYQRGGAYGFRDQLQDVTNLLLLAPDKAREHLLLCCARQFKEGDVLHWWHETPQGAKGVRTRCSDDLLWLAWALCEYVEKTGEEALCRQTAPWLDAPPLTEPETDRYFTPAVTQEESPVWHHAKAALDCVLARGHGGHGLLLTGSGDWNDGMDKVGGESLWLTWFFVHTAHRFAALLERLSLPGSDRYQKAAQHYAQAAESAWDGQWYLRGWWQDGAPLGQAGAAACAIDSLAQSWAAFCPQADKTRVKRALHACYDRLYDPAHGITKLFTPPFGDDGRDPGYIRSCGPGFRENGGQYTHGAAWLASALLQQGMTFQGTQVLLNLLPAKHDPTHFGAEPYVMPADVSANEKHYGQALWSWYTGSAGWFFRVALEDLLGIRLQDGHLVVEPHLPEDWYGYDAQIAGRKITVRHGFVRIE